MKWILAGILVGCALLLYWANCRIKDLRQQVEYKRVAAISEVHTATLNVIWDKVRAEALRDAADDWPRVDAEAERKKLSWVAVPSGESESMVVRWLNLRANRIEGYPDPEPDTFGIRPGINCRKCQQSRNAGGGPCPEHR